MTERPAKFNATAPSTWQGVLVAVGLILSFFALPHEITADGVVRFEALAALLERRELSRAHFSLIGPLFSAPCYALGWMVADPRWWCARFNTLLLSVGFAATFRLLCRDDERRILPTFFLLLLSASMFPAHLADYHGEVFTAVFVLVGIAALCSGRAALGWTLVVVGVVNTPATLVGLVLVAMKKVVDSRRLRHVVPVVVAVLLIGTEWWIRRGSPFLSGYEGNSGVQTVLPYSGRPGFSYPLFFGVLSILLSFGKGLVFFAPGLLLPISADAADVPDRLRQCYRYWVWFLAGLVIAYARWWAWYGGYSWGPRFFLFASFPASLATAVYVHRARSLSGMAAAATLAVLTLSTWVAIDGVAFKQAQLGICLENNYALEFLCWYAPEFSALWRPFVAWTAPASDAWVMAVFCLLAYAAVSAPLLASLVVAGHCAWGTALRAARTIRF